MGNSKNSQKSVGLFLKEDGKKRWKRNEMKKKTNQSERKVIDHLYAPKCQ